MLRSIAIAVVALAFTAAPSYAAPCRDVHGKFVKCADKSPAKPVRFKDAKGHFAKFRECDPTANMAPTEV